MRAAKLIVTKCESVSLLVRQPASQSVSHSARQSVLVSQSVSQSVRVSQSYLVRGPIHVLLVGPPSLGEKGSYDFITVSSSVVQSVSQLASQ